MYKYNRTGSEMKTAFDQWYSGKRKTKFSVTGSNLCLLQQNYKTISKTDKSGNLIKTYSIKNKKDTDRNKQPAPYITNSVHLETTSTRTISENHLKWCPPESKTKMKVKNIASHNTSL